jgi:hypothetical protein
MQLYEYSAAVLMLEILVPFHAKDLDILYPPRPFYILGLLNMAKSCVNKFQIITTKFHCKLYSAPGEENLTLKPLLCVMCDVFLVHLSASLSFTVISY